MATVANLYINVGARMKPLVDGMKRGQKSIRKFRRAATSSFTGIGRSIGRAVKSVGKWIGLVGGVAMAATAAAFVKTANAIDKVAKVSKRLGIGVAQLQGLHLAAKLSGIETVTLDMALQRMTRRVAEAALGMGESQAALEELGLSAKDLAKMTPDQMLMSVADALQSVPSQADKVRLAFKLFDSEGVSLVQMLGEGSDGLKKFMDRANELGLGLSQKQAAGVEAFNDSLAELGMMLKGSLQQAVVQIAPFLTDLMEKLSKSGGFATTFGKAAKMAFLVVAMSGAMVVDIGVKIAKVFFGLLNTMDRMRVKAIEGAKAFLDFIEPFKSILGLGGILTSEMLDPLHELSVKQQAASAASVAMLNGVGSAGSAVLDWFYKVGSEVENAGEIVAASAAGFDVLGESMLQVGLDSDAMTKKLKEQIATFGMSSAAAEVYALKQRGAGEATLDTIRALHGQLDGLEKQRDMMSEGERVFDSVQTPLEKYERELESLEKLLDAGAINQDTFSRAVAKAKEGLESQGDKAGAAGATDSLATAVGSITLPGMQMMETTADKTLDIEKKSYDRLGDIHDAIRRGGSVGALL